jgi:hypothetical protein
MANPDSLARHVLKGECYLALVQCYNETSEFHAAGRDCYRGKVALRLVRTNASALKPWEGPMATCGLRRGQ